MKYIHYGSDKFDISTFVPIHNREWFNKPYGGLWASPVNAQNIDWHEWCTNENFHLDKSFTFKLKPDTKVFHIDTVKDIQRLEEMIGVKNGFYVLDFELLMSMGYDAVEIYINDVDIYMKMYGWDVDSILIMNPDCIIPCD